jgi:hypothetical protein
MHCFAIKLTLTAHKFLLISQGSTWKHHSPIVLFKNQRDIEKKKSAEGFAIFSSCQKGVLAFLIKMMVTFLLD